MLNLNGHKISKIAKMSEEEVQVRVRELCETSERFPDQVNELTIAMMELDESRFERVISRNILRFTFEKTMEYSWVFTTPLSSFLSKINKLLRMCRYHDIYLTRDCTK